MNIVFSAVSSRILLGSRGQGESIYIYISIIWGDLLIYIYIYMFPKNTGGLLLVGDGYRSELKLTNLTSENCPQVYDVHFGLSELCLKAGSPEFGMSEHVAC